MHRFSEEWALVGTIDPQSVAVGTADTDVIDMQQFDEVAFVLAAGALGASATLDFSVAASAGVGMTSPVTIRSAAQLTDAGTDDNKQIILGVRNNELSSRGLRYLRGTITVAVQACQAAVLVFGRSFGAPASDYDLATVDSIKNTGT